MQVLPYFIALLYIVTSRRFHFTLPRSLWHTVTYLSVIGFAFFVFVRHTAHCFLLLVNCILCG